MKYSLDDLLQMNVSWQKTDFLFFWGHANRTEKLAKSSLSQWYPASFIVDGAYYNCAEQYMMAEKARLFGDEAVRSQIFSEYHPMAIKKLGRKVRNYDDAVWKARRFDVVVEVIWPNFHRTANSVISCWGQERKYWLKPVPMIMSGVWDWMKIQPKPVVPASGKVPVCSVLP